jgi:hypothetical protein
MSFTKAFSKIAAPRMSSPRAPAMALAMPKSPTSPPSLRMSRATRAVTSSEGLLPKADRAAERASEKASQSVKLRAAQKASSGEYSKSSSGKNPLANYRSTQNVRTTFEPPASPSATNAHGMELEHGNRVPVAGQPQKKQLLQQNQTLRQLMDPDNMYVNVTKGSYAQSMGGTLDS